MPLAEPAKPRLKNTAIEIRDRSNALVYGIVLGLIKSLAVFAISVLLS